MDEEWRGEPRLLRRKGPEHPRPPIPVHRGEGPFLGMIRQTVPDRVPPAIAQMIGIIGPAPDVVFPEPVLPQADLSLPP